ncbi:glycosyl transferase group 1 [Paenibacillus curdlanolyticus YK9]|uniref:Glycosyl transferase group 1 n=1 Tax=Paenibacillus curdlanolyticus YK9 TaxID=717606 RepID=E0I9W2_9BACL|nr:GT4 family glycosyltransferase PelF [Paenibacillus curdlanolyticus]EFM10539.1 glycosyl transferase group 1 [Paenibacillus curdlanolyticus YK9]
MKICIVAEGSYPYVTGGVSSWIHALLRSMPEHSFVIYAIAAEEEQKGKFKYELPPNVTEVREFFMDSYLKEEGRWGARAKLTSEEAHAIKSLIGGDEQADWQPIFQALLSKKLSDAATFLMSRDYYDILSELCEEKYSQVPFTEMFWTVRSMIMPLFMTVRNSLPEADLYHSVSTGYAGVIASLGKHIYNKPMVLTEHGIYSREREEEIIKSDWVKGTFKDLWIQYFYTLSKCAYQYADEVVTLFNRNKEIEIELGCPEDKISIVPNGVNAADFDNLPGKAEGAPIRVGALVRVVPIKDIKTMIQSFQLVKREVPSATFHIMGPYEEDPEYYEECLALIDAFGLQDVEFTGNVDIKQYVGTMDLLVLTSVSEGQPLAVLEGLAASKPFVTTDVGSCKELLFGVDDPYGQAGFVVPVMNAEQISRSIVTLCKNERMRNEMGGNGRRRVEALYTRDRFIDSYKALYNQLERRS